MTPSVLPTVFTEEHMVPWACTLAVVLVVGCVCVCVTEKQPGKCQLAASLDQ